MNKKTKPNKIFGIDPGSTKIGYGVIHKNDQEEPTLIDYGYIDLTKPLDVGKRLLQLYKDLSFLISKHKPDSIAVESIFFFKNAKTITPVIQSKGVILYTAAKANVNVFEYTPLQVKQTISGYGKAHKDLIQKLVQSALNYKNTIKPDDASDALAIALCHLRHLTSP